MRKLFCVIVIMFIISSCGEKHTPYKIGEERIALLLDTINLGYKKTAYLLDYKDNLKDSKNRHIVKDIAEFYNLDGYTINLYDTVRYEMCKLTKKDIKEVYVSSFEQLLPYDYRMNYINEYGDTIAQLLWRYEGEGILYTPFVLDKTQLDTVMNYLKLDYCTIYDHKINELYSKKWGDDRYAIGSYAYYLDNEVIFRNRDNDTVCINNIILLKKNETSKYIRYYSDKELNFNQVLKALEVIQLPQKNIYFHTNNNTMEYASSVYFETKDWYHIGMFSINQTFTAKYNKQNSLWATKNTYK